MKQAPRSVGSLVLALGLMFAGQPARSAIDPEGQKLIDAASCQEIQREYRNYVAAERELYDRIQRSRAGTAAANVAGVAAFAVQEGARKKACAL